MRDLKLLDYLDGLFRYAVTLSHDRSAAEELVQEAYLRALPAIPKLKTNSNVKSWLFTILRNIWLNQLRQRRAHPTDDLERSSTEPGLQIELSPYDAHVSEVERQHVREAIEHLPVHFREVITLREFEELSYGEIARVLNCPIGTVMSRLARARAQLRDILSRNAVFAPRQANASRAS